MYDTTGTPSSMEEPPSAARQENARASPSKFSGRLVDDKRISVREKGIWVDDPSAISEELIALIPKKLFKMRTVFEQTVKDLYFEGQVGFICLDKNYHKEPLSCVAVTALHNIAEVKDNPQAKFVRSVALFPDFATGIPFPEAGIKLINITPHELSPFQEFSIPWKHGIDIAWSSKVFTAALAPEVVECSFERIRDDFHYKAGQKIGIGVFSDTGATEETVGNPNVTNAELLRIYGPPKTIHMYTGKITMVCEHHIEYDINSFEGCAGAMVFLLGLETQPNDSGVIRDDVGKAIAVHAGAHPRKIKNFGFKFTAKPRPSKC